MEPAVALLTCEVALRQLMRVVFTKKYGAGWIERIASPGQIEKWRERREYEQKKRLTRGAGMVPSNELEYADLYDLNSIAQKHWPDLQPALGRQKETGALLKRFDDLRNSVAHSREILPFEADLLSGIAGEIRNRVAIYMSDQDPGGSYFPRIETVVDSFGHSPEDLTPRQGLTVVNAAGVILRPGDAVQFRCRGTDPHGREMQWYLDDAVRTGFVQGDDVVLTWYVSDEDVRNSRVVDVRMAALDTRYHRFGIFDHGVSFIYQVLPPVGHGVGEVAPAVGS